MKKSKIYLKKLLFIWLVFITTSTFAQFNQLGNVLSTGVDDAESILGAYITPYANGMGASLSGGWYNTAKTHKLGGFDVTFTANVVFIPSSDKTFNPGTLNLGDPDNGVYATVSGDNSPTAAGKYESGPLVTYTKDIYGTPNNTADDVMFSQFNLPKGSNFSYSYMPMVQIGLGLVKETEINVRYSPNITYGKGGKIGLWGVGLKHSLKQWIPVLKKLPILELSLQGGYTKLTSTNDLDFQPSFYTDNNLDVTIVPAFDPNYYSNQQMIMDIRNTTANLLVSANLPVICVYGGIGISSSKTNLRLEGNYPIPYFQGTDIRISDENLDNTNPIDIDIKSSDLRLNAGFRIKMAVVTLHFDYTYANYSIATAGLGINFR